MGEFKGTPGPWGLSSQSPTIIKQCMRHIGLSADAGVLIGSACGHTSSGFYPSDEEAIANARLIAAAPDLLDALSPLAAMYQPEVVGYMGAEHPDHDFIFAVNGKGLRLGDLRRAVAAIAKATTP